MKKNADKPNTDAKAKGKEAPKVKATVKRKVKKEVLKNGD